jgi:lipoprotein-anchoring transpeptidase ErfK/SrfK
MQPAVNQQIPEGGEKLIVVSISQQHVYAYQGGVLVYSFVASTGSGNSTRTGTFSILDKISKAYGSTWNFWMPDWMGIYYAGGLEDGFHSLPLLNNGQRLWGNSLGTPVTYGCIVLGIQDSKTLYDWAEIGTTVQIKR